MYPTKSMIDYMTEMNRLFPRNVENDVFLPSTTMNQFYNQSIARSSSSTDTSPDSFPDIMMGCRFPHLQSPVRPDQSPAKPGYTPRQSQRLDFSTNPYDSHQQIYETPLMGRRERPIMGRKIIPEKHEISNIWTEESHVHPPNAHMNQAYYELFPSDAKGMQNEYRSRTSSYISQEQSVSNTTNMSYASSMSQWNETMSEVSGLSTTPPQLYPRSPGSSTSPHSRIPSRFSFKEPITGPSTSFRSTGSTTMCTFCRKNGETPLVYMTHAVKEKIGNTHVVTCPILRSHVCSTCGASGDNAHTISYCPVLRSTNNGKPLPSTTVTLKNTRVKSNGCTT